MTTLTKNSSVRRLLSGRYRTCWLRRHWSGNISGDCEVPGCTPGTPGSLVHIATGQCTGLTAATTAAAEQWANFISLNAYLVNLFRFVSAASQDEGNGGCLLYDKIVVV